MADSNIHDGKSLGCTLDGQGYTIRNFCLEDAGSKNWDDTSVSNPGRFGRKGNVPRIFNTVTSSHAEISTSQTGNRIHTTPTATSYTVLLTDHLISVTNTASARVVTLPSAVTAGAGAVFTIKDESGAAGTNNITVKATAGTLDGVAAATGIAIATNYGKVSYYSNGTNWFSK